MEFSPYGVPFHLLLRTLRPCNMNSLRATGMNCHPERSEDFTE